MGTRLSEMLLSNKFSELNSEHLPLELDVYIQGLDIGGTFIMIAIVKAQLKSRRMYCSPSPG